MTAALRIPLDRIPDFSRRWGIAEFSLFGSVLRDDFHPSSDVDVLVAYHHGRRPSLEDWIAMREELQAMLGGREIDLVERRAIINPFRRHEILTTRRVLYAA